MLFVMATASTANTEEVRIVKEPRTEKTAAIIEAALQSPNASNPDIADAVEDAIGDRPDESWVSRVRSNYLEDVSDEPDVDEDDPEDVAIDDGGGGTEAVGVAGDVATVIDRLDDVEDAVDRIAHDARTNDRTFDRVETLTESIGALRDDVAAIHDRLDRIEDMVAKNVTEDVERVVLERRLSELTDDA